MTKKKIRGNDLVVFNGEEKKLSAHCKDSGINLRTVTDRLNKFGWDIERALTEKPNTALTTHKAAIGFKIKENVRLSFDKVWAQCGQKEFERQLAEAFQEDALKVVKDFVSYMPKDMVQAVDQRPAQTVVHIELAKDQRPLIIDQGAHG